MMVDSSIELRVAVVGAGYWGPNLVRNFEAHPQTDLVWVCDLDVDRAQRTIGRHSTVSVTSSLDDVLDDVTVDAVAIATPVHTHTEVAVACLDAGKHVLIEKPLAASLAEGQKLVALAEDRDLVLMCDHTYCYTPAVQRLRELAHGGALGDIQYVDSVRINLGLVQSDVDVWWDLAPHDLSILEFILPATCAPVAVAAHGADPIGAGQACVGYLTLPLSNGGIAHIHVNWLSPTKIRTTIVGGTKRMVVWDDLSPAQRLRMYDCGVEVSDATIDDATRHGRLVSYRVGDMVAPALPEREALIGVVGEFVASINQHRPPLTDGRAGVRILQVLEAASSSAATGSGLVPLEGSW
jgi:predicted dehydrogenase